MRNKISIDELVRQKIAQGEEPHNLGAWANMERMLDGKNPYQEKEEKKRRPFLFLILALLLSSTAVIGGYNYFSNSSNQPSSSRIAKTPSNAINQKDVQSNLTSTVTENSVAQTEANNSDEVLLANNSKNESLQLEAIKSNSQNTIKNNLQKSTRTQSRNSTSFGNERQQQTTAIINSNKIEESKQETAGLLASNAKKTIKSNFNTINAEKATKIKSPIAKNTTANKSVKTVAKNSPAKKSNSNEKNIPPTITENYSDTTTVTEVTQKLKTNDNGKKVVVSDSFQYDLVQQKQRTVVNPRFVELSQAEEISAQRRTTLASKAANSPSNNASDIISANKKAESISTNTANKINKDVASKTTADAKAKVGFLSMFKRASQSINQTAINITHKKFPLYAGMFAGVNAALINSKHNFGGFQGGFTVMTPLSRLLTLQTEARFIHKNNSGYTIKDSKYIIKNTTTTNTAKGTVYNYEIDSVSRGYNLKNFYTIQIPVILNANINKFNVYGGMHFNHGFRMNINTTDKSYAISRSDTATNASYVLRTNTETKFTRDDFASRLGLGYTIGGGYNVNSKVSVDLRMSNLFWDNTTGANKQEISDVFFRIPSFQLSIGYRFRGYEKEQ